MWKDMFPNKIRLITFDVTHTLLKFTVFPSQYYAEVASKHGVHTLDDPEAQKGVYEDFVAGYKTMSKQHPNFGRDSIDWSNWWREVIKMTLKRHLTNVSKETVEKIGTDLIEDFKTAKRWGLHDGSLELLDYLKTKNIKFGIISNFDPRLSDILENTKLMPYFDFVLTSYEVGKMKPDLAIFEEALKRSGLTDLTSKEALHIGDDLQKDYQGAMEAGWQAVLIGRECNEQNSFKDLIKLKENFVKDESNIFFKS